jgi:hypothetical protein
MKITNIISGPIVAWDELSPGEGFVVDYGREPQIKTSKDQYFSFTDSSVYCKSNIFNCQLYRVDLELIVRRPIYLGKDNNE